jgi:hypothetical protein
LDFHAVDWSSNPSSDTVFFFSKSGFGFFLVHEGTSVNYPRVDLVQRLRVDVGEVHVRGIGGIELWEFVSQVSIFCDVHAWTFPKFTRGHRFSARTTVVGIGDFSLSNFIAADFLSSLSVLVLNSKFSIVINFFMSSSKEGKRFFNETF